MLVRSGRLAAMLLQVVGATAAFSQTASERGAASGAGADTLPWRVVSFNIRYDTPKDEQRAWRFRSDRLIEHVSSMNADFIGFQEVLPSQRADLSKGLPGYGSIGRSRDPSPAEGEATPIYFHRGRWAPIESRAGTFWLSETPDVAGSRSWKSSVPRIATWGVFRELATGRRVFVLNTHLDHESQEARERGAQVIAEFVAQEAGDLPVIVMGDFNAEPANPARKALCEGTAGSPRLTDTYAATHPGVERGTGTYHAFQGGASGARIDAILVSDEFEVARAEIDRTGDDGAHLSDHWPVIAELRLVRDKAPDGDRESRPSPPSVPPRESEPGAR